MVLAAVLVTNANRLTSRQPEVTAAARPALDTEALARRLGEGLRFATVSHQDPTDVDHEAFAHFRQWLEATYPALHAAAPPKLVGDSLLFTWDGSEPELEPALLLAHYDVVPVNRGTEEEWQEPPFSGTVDDTFVWGRGAVDDKGPLLAIVEAAELLANRGHRPRRTVLLAFGHDEEVGGREGAQQIASLLAKRSITPAFVLDEGGVLTEGMLPIDRPVALVGIAEKGYVTLELAAHAAGGHSSMPPRQTAVSRLAQGLERLTESPFAGGLGEVSGQTFATLAPELGFVPRLAVANRWLLGSLLERLLASQPQTDALLRTTIAPTMLEGSDKENVLPQAARAWVNFRIHPRDSVASVIAHVERAVRGLDIDVQPVNRFSSEPSAVSPTDSWGYGLIERSVREVFPESIVTPYLVMAGTDARHYEQLTPNVYRFTGILLGADDSERIHGTNERVSKQAYADAVAFYVRLLENADGPAT